MKKYMVLYHAPAEAFAGMADMTEEQKMEGMKPWQEWQAKVGEALVDFGSPLMMGRSISPDGSCEPSTKQVAGYSILQAGSFDEAQDLLREHPHLAWHGGCNIEVHEMAPMM